LLLRTEDGCDSNAIPFGPWFLFTIFVIFDIARVFLVHLLSCSRCRPVQSQHELMSIHDSCFISDSY